MPSLKAIRNRIASVKSTQKITRAMKMVAAARLRRAQDAVLAARPYARHMAGVVHDLVVRMTDDANDARHPLLAPRSGAVKGGKLRLVVITSDRGLAGGYNSNLSRFAERTIIDEKPNFSSIELAIVGRKGKEYFRRRKPAPIHKEYNGVQGDSALARSREIGADLSADFFAGEVDQVWVLYNEFKSAISQIPSVIKLLPLSAAKSVSDGPRSLVDFVYEPSRGQVLETLLPLYLNVQLYQVMLEAVASEFGAKMSAMDNATTNAKEMISSLTLVFNRARQAAITKELMEIVGGAEALKG